MRARVDEDATIGVGFDIDHTIAIDNKLERVALLRLLEPMAEDGGIPTENLADEIDRVDRLLAEQRAGKFTIDEAVRRFVRERGVTSRDERYVERFKTMALAMVDQFVIPMPSAKRTFDRLIERGARIAVLSNGWNPLQVRKARRTGFEGAVIASADIGERKPDARAFNALLETLGTRPERTWFVGDDPWADVDGARAAGLRAVWLDAEHAAFPPALAAPRYIIHALDELPALVLST